VHLAAQSFPERQVALKILSADLAHDPSFRGRFIRESNAAAAIEHPNIVPVHAAGEAAGACTSRCGTSREPTCAPRWSTTVPLSPERAAQTCAQVADALEAAHERGLVHRAVKPGNVLLDSREHAYLSDFGLIKPTQTAPSSRRPGSSRGAWNTSPPSRFAAIPSMAARTSIHSGACCSSASQDARRSIARTRSRSVPRSTRILQAASRRQRERECQPNILDGPRRVLPGKTPILAVDARGSTGEGDGSGRPRSASRNIPTSTARSVGPPRSRSAARRRSASSGSPRTRRSDETQTE
jgi:serine/threonine protein kinase